MNRAIKLDISTNDFLKQTKEEIAIERGKRLRMARVLSGLSRQEFQDTLSVSTSTLNAWENGRICLTEKGAIRVSNALSKVNIVCSASWLLDGIGESPRSMDAVKLNLAGLEGDSIRDNIIDEIAFFSTRNKGGICVKVGDDSMAPFYVKGDFVAGIVDNDADHYKEYVGCNVIFSHKKSQYIKHVDFIKDGVIGFSNASCVSNSNTNASDMVISISDIEYLAKIVFHRSV